MTGSEEDLGTKNLLAAGRAGGYREGGPIQSKCAFRRGVCVSRQEEVN